MNKLGVYVMEDEKRGVKFMPFVESDSSSAIDFFRSFINDVDFSKVTNIDKSDFVLKCLGTVDLDTMKLRNEKHQIVMKAKNLSILDLADKISDSVETDGEDDE